MTGARIEDGRPWRAERMAVSLDHTLRLHDDGAAAHMDAPSGRALAQTIADRLAVVATPSTDSSIGVLRDDVRVIRHPPARSRSIGCSESDGRCCRDGSIASSEGEERQ